MMSSIPGSAGMTVLGDKSWEFYKDAIGFVNKRMEQHKSRTFLSRILNKPTVFLASNADVRELLNDNHECTDLGYKAFLHQIYGHNIVFSNGKEAEDLRNIMHELFNQQTVLQFESTINSLTERTLNNLETGTPVSAYCMFKQLATEICLSIFLDIDFESSTELAQNIVALTTTHWHGIISMPVSVKVPMMTSSTYSKALEAKGHLLDIIHQKLANSSNGFPKSVGEKPFSSPELASNHTLLFTSALVPKALASLLTSFVIAIGNRKGYQDNARKDDTCLHHFLLETQRLWPPFLGGRRLVRKTCTIGGQKIPAGHAVIYMSHQAHRDPDVFTDPDEFMPARWSSENVHDTDKLFTFGGGPRDCVGQQLVNRILMIIAKGLVTRYSWEIAEGQNLQYKWLPVSRPVDCASVIFSKHAENS